MVGFLIFWLACGVAALVVARKRGVKFALTYPSKQDDTVLLCLVLGPYALILLLWGRT